MTDVPRGQGGDGSPLDWSEVLCRIEGCPRAFPDYGDEACGLARIYKFRDVPMPPECGSVATVDKWEAMGLFDD